MRELATEGLVDLDPHRGVVVHTPTTDELSEIYELRLTLEPLGIRRAMEFIQGTDLKRAEQLCARMEGEAEAGAWADLNRQFHSVVLAASRRPLLVALLNNLRDRSSIYVALSLSDRGDRMMTGNAEHRALLEAIKAVDVEAATRIMAQHLASTVGLADEHLADCAPRRQTDESGPRA